MVMVGVVVVVVVVVHEHHVAKTQMRSSGTLDYLVATLQFIIGPNFGRLEITVALLVGF